MTRELFYGNLGAIIGVFTFGLLHDPFFAASFIAGIAIGCMLMVVVPSIYQFVRKLYDLLAE